MLEEMTRREEKMKKLIKDKEQEIATLKERVTSLTTQLEEKEEMISQQGICWFIKIDIDKILLFFSFIKNA